MRERRGQGRGGGTGEVRGRDKQVDVEGKTEDRGCDREG